MVTPVALLGYVIHRVEEPHSVGTGHYAVAAPYAPSPVNQDYAIPRLVRGPNRTDLNTGRLVALITQLGHKKGFGYLILRNDYPFGNFRVISYYIFGEAV